MKRRHHVVPRHYLDGWAHDGRLTQVHLPGDRSHPVSTGDAAVQKHFYTLETADGASDEFEDFLAGIESLAAPAIQRLAAGPVALDTNDRYAVAAWTAAQHLRTEAQRRAVEDVADIAVKLQIGIEGKPGVARALAAAGEEPTDEAVDEMWESLTDLDDWRVGLSPNAHIRAIIDNLQGTTNVFFARSWTAVRFKRRSLLTSDTPVVLLPHPDEPPWMGIGIINSGGALIPLSRRAALVMGPLDTPDRDLPGTTKLATTFNQYMAAQARRLIFHHPDDADLLTQLELPEPRNREMHAGDLSRFMLPEGWPSSEDAFSEDPADG